MTKKKTKTTLVFDYKFAPDYSELYVTGARGVVQSGYHLHLDFYIEKLQRTLKQELQVDTEENSEVLSGKIVDIGKSDIPVVERKYVVGLNIPFHAVFELHKYLGERLKEIKKIEGRIEEVQEESEDVQ